MPFTFSHPAIVLPLIKKYKTRLSATGLIIGSMTPDFESFIKLGGDKIYGHSWKGVIWFDMPLALFLIFLFQLVVKKPLIDNLPIQLRERFTVARNSDWLPYFKNNAFIVVISLFIGIMSHMLWDAFTHLNLRYPDAIYSRIKWRNHRVYVLLQYACSVIGIVWITYFVYKMPQEKVTRTKIGKGTYWVFVFLIMLGVMYLMFNSGTEKDPIGFIDKINISISGVFYGIVVVSLVKNLLTDTNGKLNLK